MRPTLPTHVQTNWKTTVCQQSRVTPLKYEGGLQGGNMGEVLNRLNPIEKCGRVRGVGKQSKTKLANSLVANSTLGVHALATPTQVSATPPPFLGNSPRVFTKHFPLAD